MPTRESAWPEGTPAWVDLAVDDFAKGQEFYSTLFGWDVPTGEEEFGGYSTATKDGQPVAGISPKQDPNMPTFWTTYLAVDDVDATVEKAKQAGGQVMFEPLQVADFGKMAIIVDPAGAGVGLWQSGSNTGFNVYNEHGSVTWDENLSRDWQKNKEFYSQVFGYSYEDMGMPDFPYATIKSRDGEVVAGIGQMGSDFPEQVPPHWNTYFKVDDMTAAVDTLRKLGGQVMKEPWDTPFGTMAAVADNQGAPFMLMADNEQSRGQAQQ